MIELADGFVILVDEYEYTVAEKTGKKDKDGRERYIYHGHYSGLIEAINGMRDIFIRRKLQNGSVSLSEALAVLHEANAKFDDMLEEAGE